MSAHDLRRRVARLERLTRLKECTDMADQNPPQKQQNPPQPAQQQPQGQPAQAPPQHAQALAAAGLDWGRIAGLALPQILALVQALLDAARSKPGGS